MELHSLGRSAFALDWVLLLDVQVVAATRNAYYQFTLLCQLHPLLGEMDLATATHVLVISWLNCWRMLYMAWGSPPNSTEPSTGAKCCSSDADEPVDQIALLLLH